MKRTSTDAGSQIVNTIAETFPDGAAIEAVCSTASGRLALLLFRDSRKKTIASQVKYAGQIYRPLALEETTLRATRFPQDAKNYGSPRKLLSRIREVIEMYSGVTEQEASLITAWAISSWFADCIASPPTLFISGPDMGRAITLFRVLQCVCRRAVLLGDLNRSSFLSLAYLAPTFLVNAPDLPPRLRNLWTTSNFRGVHVFGSGKARSLATSKAVFLGMANTRNDEGLHFTLRPALDDFRQVTDSQLSAIAEELQPQLLSFRLRNFERVRNPPPSADSSTRSRGAASYVLETSVMGDAETVKSMAPLLQQIEQDTIVCRGCVPHFAMIEVMWRPSHTEWEISISRLTNLTNALVRSRGELLEYSAEDIGWKLRSLGLLRHRNGRGMVFRFSQENRLAVHRLATQWGLDLEPVPDCPFCSTGKANDPQGLVQVL